MHADGVSSSSLGGERDCRVEPFGVGDVGTMYRLHCPMALGGRGAIWFQDNDDTRNPYYGATMLKCADEVEAIVPSSTAPHADESHADESRIGAHGDH